MNTPLLLGHRGDRGTVLENTFNAFDLALANGCDGFEFDVRLSLDLQGIVVHDPDISGTLVSDNSFAALSIHSHKKDAKDNIPRLEDVIRCYAKQSFLDIELKVGGLESSLIALLKKNPPEHGYVVSSFSPEIIQHLWSLDNTVKLGFICEYPETLSLWRDLPAEYVIPKFDLIDTYLVQEVHQAGRKLLAWTVNDAKLMLYLEDIGVDGIISDDTRLLVQTLRYRG